MGFFSRLPVPRGMRRAPDRASTIDWYMSLDQPIYCAFAGGFIQCEPHMGSSLRKQSSSPTILRIMGNYVSLQFDRRLVERLHRQRSSLRYEAPELSELFGLFDALVNEVWNADVETRVAPPERSCRRDGRDDDGEALGVSAGQLSQAEMIEHGDRCHPRRALPIERRPRDTGG